MRKIKIVTIVLILSFLAASCMPLYNSEEKDDMNNVSQTKGSPNVMDKGPVRGGTLKLFATKSDTLNPIITNNAYVQDFLGLVFEGLVKLGKNQRPLPCLSDKWEVTEDGTTWTFHIRDNVSWHNNKPLTAEDVVYTIDVIKDRKVNSVYKANVENIAVYTAIDHNNLRIVLKSPDTYTVEKMTFPIISNSYYKGDVEYTKTNKKNMKPVGTGPYAYEAKSKKGDIKLKANRKWWNAKTNSQSTPEAPYIDKVDVKVFSSSSSMISAFENGQVDVVPIQAGDISLYTDRTNLSLRRYESRNFEFLAFNQSDYALSSRVVRQAIAYAIDRKKIVNSVLPGEALVSDIPLLPDCWVNGTNKALIVKDKNKAKKLLAQDGWKDYSGTLYKYGVPLRLQLLVNEYNDTRLKVAEKIAAQLKEIGITVTVVKMKWEDMLSRIKYRQYDMALMGYRISSIPDISFAYSTDGSRLGLNVTGYKNKTLDGLFENLSLEYNSVGKRNILSDIKEIIAQDTPYVGLYFYNGAMLYNKRIKGALDPTAWNKYNDLTRWYIPK